MADLLLPHTLQWIVHAAHNLLLLGLHHTLGLTRIASRSRHLRRRLAHDQRLLTANELLLIWLHLLHSHGVWLLETTVLLLHSVHASRLNMLRVLARSHLLLGTLAHDIALWIASDRLLSHFNIIVYYNSAKAFKKLDVKYCLKRNMTQTEEFLKRKYDKCRQLLALQTLIVM